VRGRGFATWADQVAHRGGVGFMKYEKTNNSRFIDCVFEELSDCEHKTITGVSIWACRNILFQGNTFQNLDGTGI